ncbi:hypothetical protein H6P81_016917 [Aristolochia fimbriata]|uniref:Uncharacterized protein n=1 Tax=Aristolochia fimbriata TaxID=158543 RepID=A0AAV7E0W5_ARIFI|nr:hypothetical protein H6P81_016917 [Aristolochia fimbriata]
MKLGLRILLLRSPRGNGKLQLDLLREARPGGQLGRHQRRLCLLRLPRALLLHQPQHHRPGRRGRSQGPPLDAHQAHHPRRTREQPRRQPPPRLICKFWVEVLLSNVGKKSLLLWDQIL